MSHSECLKYAPATQLNAPPEWRAKLDFVFEAYAIQALPRSQRVRAITALASLVDPTGGQLLIICRVREENEDLGSLPGPISRDEMQSFEQLGLRLVSFDSSFDNLKGGEPVRRFRALYQKG